MHAQQVRRSARGARVLTLLLCSLALRVAVGQQAPAAASPTAPPATQGRDMPRPDQLEPGVDTTRSTAVPAATRNVGSAPATQTAVAAGGARSVTTAPKAAAAPPGAAAPKAGARKGVDRLVLDPTDVRGNAELPKVLYIVPWKHSDLGDLVGRPANSLLDEVLQPLDRDVFRRENRYYDALTPDRAAPNSDAAQGSGVKP